MPRTIRQNHACLPILVLLVVALLGACSSGEGEAEADGPVQVEIISLDHAPIRPETEEVANLVAEYGEEITLSSYQFGTPEGDSFADDNGLTDHTPIAIFVNGESRFDIDGRTLEFLSFPQGEGTGIVADGDWTIDDLRPEHDRAVRDPQAG